MVRVEDGRSHKDEVGNLGILRYVIPVLGQVIGRRVSAQPKLADARTFSHGLDVRIQVKELHYNVRDYYY